MRTCKECGNEKEITGFRFRTGYVALDEFYKLCHHANLQPLWASDNLKKWAHPNHVITSTP